MFVRNFSHSLAFLPKCPTFQTHPSTQNLQRIWIRSFTTTETKIAYLETTLKQLRDISKEPSVKKTRLIEQIGNMYLRDGNRIPSQRCFVDALNEYRDIFGEKSPFVLNMKKKIAENVSQTGQEDLAASYLADNYRELGNIYCVEGQIDHAIEQYKKELVLREKFEKTSPIATEKLLEFSHSDCWVKTKDYGITKTLAVLGNCYLKIGDEETAQYYFNKASAACAQRINIGNSYTNPLENDSIPPPLESFFYMTTIFYGLDDPFQIVELLKSQLPELHQNLDSYTPNILYMIGQCLSRYNARKSALHYFEQHALDIHQEGKRAPLASKLQKSSKLLEMNDLHRIFNNFSRFS